MSSLWKPQIGFHSDLEISQQREIPTFPQLIMFEKSVTHVTGLFCYPCFRLHSLRIVTMDDPQPPKRESGSMADTARTIGALSTVGLSFVLSIVIGAGLGWYLDKSFGTAPWMFFLFFAIGVAAGVLNVYRIAGRILK